MTPSRLQLNGAYLRKVQTLTTPCNSPLPLCCKVRYTTTMDVKPVETDPVVYFKKGLIALLVLALLGAGLYGGYRGYRVWEQKRLLARAEKMVLAGDLTNAALAAQRVLKTNPVSIPATRILADVSEKWLSSNALFWRIRAAGLEPDNVQAKLAVARTALLFNRVSVARRALDEVPESERGASEYQKLLAEYAAKSGNAELAEGAWSRLAAEDADNKEYAIALAAARLRVPDAAKQQSAREYLLAQRDDATYGAAALRALVTDRVTPLSASELRTMAVALHSHPQATITDHLVALQILRDSPEFETRLAATMELAKQNPDFFYALLMWLDGVGETERALTLADAHPEMDQVPLCMAHAALLSRAEKWGDIQHRYAKSDWGVFDYFRFAYLARAEREMQNETMARTYLSRAIAGATSTLGGTAALSDLLESWPGWSREVETLLWRAAKSSTDRQWALRALFDFHAKHLDTRGLLRVAEEMVKFNPDDRGAENNRIMFHLLTGGNAQAALKDAENLHANDPENPVFLSTYAFALHSAGKTEEGLERLESLPEETRNVPQFAAYYGILLAAAGRAEEAQKYLAQGLAVPLLPEEVVLVQKAQGKYQPQK